MENTVFRNIIISAHKICSFPMVLLLPSLKETGKTTNPGFEFVYTIEPYS